MSLSGLTRRIVAITFVLVHVIVVSSTLLDGRKVEQSLFDFRSRVTEFPAMFGSIANALRP